MRCLNLLFGPYCMEKYGKRRKGSLMGFFTNKVLGAGGDADLKRYRKMVTHINDLEPEFQALPDSKLHEKTSEFLNRHDNGESLDTLLPEAFACAREACRRAVGKRPYDEQIMSGIALHEGKVAENETGSGKTLMAVMPAYLNALDRRGVHIVTVNEYLADRDAHLNSPIFHMLGLGVGEILSSVSAENRKRAYGAAITYGTNTEFGFDYLRDNMATSKDAQVARGYHYAIVDEVDSILIDEARTPLIIAGPGKDAADAFRKFAAAVRGLKREEDYELDEKKKEISLTETGLSKVEGRLGMTGIFDDRTGLLANYLHNAVKAQYMFERNKDYIVRNGNVEIVDEFTGRVLEGRRWSDGLHQAVEAKEGVEVKAENQTLASVTLQNFFRLYDKLAGMSGTALTEDREFRSTYGMSVVAIPPHKASIREDLPDELFRTHDGKIRAVVEDVRSRHAKGQPVLIGTSSVEASEELSRALDEAKIPHQTLNAKQDAEENEIVAEAGRLGAVTVATNMAGRGTDIKLGSSPEDMAPRLLRLSGIDPAEATTEQRADAEGRARVMLSMPDGTTEHDAVLAAGGLAIIGTERHEARRIDNQLRGRSGRQGDPGQTRFYLSLEDDLLRLFEPERLKRVDKALSLMSSDDSYPLTGHSASSLIEHAQAKVEGRSFEQRKNVLDYDDVMDKQRRAIYGQRQAILDGEPVGPALERVMSKAAATVMDQAGVSGGKLDDEGAKALNETCAELTGLPSFAAGFELEVGRKVADVEGDLAKYLARCAREHVEKLAGSAAEADKVIRRIMLSVIDSEWQDHLKGMDYLKSGIGIRSYGQRDPLVEYKEAAFNAFSGLVDDINDRIAGSLFSLKREERVPMPSAMAAMPRGTVLSAPNDLGTESAKVSRDSGVVTVHALRPDVVVPRAILRESPDADRAASARREAMAAQVAQAAGAQMQVVTAVRPDDEPQPEFAAKSEPVAADEPYQPKHMAPDNWAEALGHRSFVTDDEREAEDGR